MCLMIKFLQISGENLDYRFIVLGHWLSIWKTKDLNFYLHDEPLHKYIYLPIWTNVHKYFYIIINNKELNIKKSLTI